MSKPAVICTGHQVRHHEGCCDSQSSLGKIGGMKNRTIHSRRFTDLRRMTSQWVGITESPLQMVDTWCPSKGCYFRLPGRGFQTLSRILLTFSWNARRDLDEALWVCSLLTRNLVQFVLVLSSFYLLHPVLNVLHVPHESFWKLSLLTWGIEPAMNPMALFQISVYEKLYSL